MSQVLKISILTGVLVLVYMHSNCVVNINALHIVSTVKYSNNGFAHILSVLPDNKEILNETTVSGRVTDELGTPLANVSVTVVNNTSATRTDNDGQYKISVNQSRAELIFSHIGYETYHEIVTESKEINVILKKINEGLDEVVVIGYGVQKKRDLTGSVASVKGDDILNVATNRAIEGLQGKAAGINIVRESGRPGDGVKVRIRGIGTINNSDPLYVIDGIPGSSMGNIDANDIQSIEILKDASATAIYGSRGANGVVLVTTKSGSYAEKTIVSLNSYYSTEKIRPVALLKGYEYAMLFLEASENDGSSFNEKQLELLNNAVANKTEGTDWQRAIFQTGSTQNHQVSIQGGLVKDANKRLKYYTSLAYNDVKGTIKYTGFDRVGFISKIDVTFNKRLKGGFDLRYTLTNNKGQAVQGQHGDNPISQALWASPLMPVKNEDGIWGDMWFNEQQRNAAAIVEFTKEQNIENSSFNPRAWLELDVWKGLKIKTLYSYSRDNMHNKQYTPSYRINSVQFNQDTKLFEARASSSGWYWNNLMYYDKEIGSYHHIAATLGHEATYATTDGFNITASQGIPEDEQLHYLNRGTAFGVPGAIQNQMGMVSYFLRLNYGYKDKYLLTSTVRRDGSYKFSDANKWGTFPSVGFAWKISQENFMKNVTLINDAKVRVGWGQVGNESSAQPYSYLSTVTINNIFYPINGVTAFRGGIPIATVNPNLKWETVESTNLGIDLELFNRAVNFSADYFIKTTRDMIVQLPTPAFTSNEDPFMNVGSMKNSGLELVLGYNKKSNNFSWGVNGNISFLKNRVISLGDKDFIQGGRTTDKIIPEWITRTQKGEEVAYFVGYRYEGIYRSQQEIDNSGLLNKSTIMIGDARFKDQNGDGILNELDYIKLGSAIPDYIYGLNAFCSYKGFDINITVIGSKGNELINAMSPYLTRGEGYSNQLRTRLNRYHPVNNPSGTQARMSIQDNNENFEKMSNFFVEDGSFLKIRTIQLGYNIPQNIIRKLHISRCRLYCTAQNMFTFTKYSGYDPEIADFTSRNPNASLAAGIDMGNYPIPRSFVVGLNLSF